MVGGDGRGVGRGGIEGGLREVRVRVRVRVRMRWWWNGIGRAGLWGNARRYWMSLMGESRVNDIMLG